MPIPQLTNHGLLPDGIHDCTYAEAFTRFAINPAREIIWQNLMTTVEEMHTERLSGDLHLDGSFVTDKPVPEDIDVILDVRNEPAVQQGLALRYFHLNHVNLKARNVDWWPSLPAENNFVSFFQYVGSKTATVKGLAPKDRKGILRITQW